MLTNPCKEHMVCDTLTDQNQTKHEIWYIGRSEAKDLLVPKIWCSHTSGSYSCQVTQNCKTSRNWARSSAPKADQDIFKIHYQEVVHVAWEILCLCSLLHNQPGSRFLSPGTVKTSQTTRSQLGEEELFPAGVQAGTMNHLVTMQGTNSWNRTPLKAGILTTLPYPCASLPLLGSYSLTSEGLSGC